MALLIAVSLICSCAPSRFVKPLEKREWAVGVNAGGPLINLFNTTMPVPFSSVYAGYGFTDKLTTYGGIHTTSLIYKTLQLDAGATYLVRDMGEIAPAVSLSGSLNGMMDFREFNTRIYPAMAANLFYDYKFGRTYSGMEQWIDLYKNEVPDGSQYNPWVPAFYLGQSLKLRKWELTLEYKYLAPFSQNKGHVVRYATVGDVGANGLYLSVQKRF